MQSPTTDVRAPKRRPLNGFLVLDKPAGWTSHDVVARVRRLVGQKRVGHTGTLDPDATGVLLVCLGHATRLIEYTGDYHKVYRARLALGVETDSQDASGAIIRRADASAVTMTALEDVLPRFTGEIEQIPPMVSAVHHGGERLYEIARRGETVERAPRPVTIFSLTASDFVPGEVARALLDIECSGGTYIRTVCHDIGEALAVGGHMEALRRTRVGPFSVDDAHSLDTLAEGGDDGALEGLVQPMGELLPPAWARVDGSADLATSILQGRAIPATGDDAWAVFHGNGRMVAILRRDEDVWRPVKVFPENSQSG